jgi:hypothetical protein
VRIRENLEVHVHTLSVRVIPGPAHANVEQALISVEGLLHRCHIEIVSNGRAAIDL